MTGSALARELILCPSPSCRRQLGEHIGPLFIGIHVGRLTSGPMPVMIRCERCGTTWWSPAVSESLRDLDEIVERIRAELPLVVAS
jgi:hypothetical protein